ncbi:uncharacterized protein LOC130642685 isoform X1 [Hydractinia symbiolongicarpus]|uniref:uncharacterized protein LOC130642685 isoform X1 n=1 Tax=Hydractinia symbiolongicarpus TaxID=13093 RepID=UPI00254AE561|nr:uncharacterized protein LOC130642685 isoform X1 [Hydractinia symbiolongicarpus]
MKYRVKGFLRTAKRYLLRERMSLRELEKPWNTKKLNDFLKAWKLIKELPPDNPNSFWSLATYHGVPFKKTIVEDIQNNNNTVFEYLRHLFSRKDDIPHNRQKWGGYCQHANVLFPSWHRLYLLRVEQALQTVIPGKDVALHYWDQTSEESLQHGLPSILTRKTVMIDGKEEVNPLLSFTLPRQIDADENSFYKKPIHYTTVRYPFSGIMNPKTAAEIANKHNEKLSRLNKSPDELLNENIKYWLNHGFGKKNSVVSSYEDCLDETDYNKFSNTSSARIKGTVAISLEQPHNDMHLSIGGFSLPKTNEHGEIERDNNGHPIIQNYGLVEGANGDMGANEMAAFDPIFFVHHANVDRMFWAWQKKHNHSTVETSFKIRQEKRSEVGRDDVLGTSTNGQGPSPNQSYDEILGMDTVLYPFQNSVGMPMTTKDCVDIEAQLGYTYSVGSFDKFYWPSYAPKIKYSYTVTELTHFTDLMKKLTQTHTSNPKEICFDFTSVIAPTHHWETLPFFKKGSPEFTYGGCKWKRMFYLRVCNLKCDDYPGSFVVRAFYKKNGKEYFAGQRGVLNRWNRKICKNCQYNNFKSVVFKFHEKDVSFPTEVNKIDVDVLAKNPATGNNEVHKICCGEGSCGDKRSPKKELLVSFEELTKYRFF